MTRGERFTFYGLIVCAALVGISAVLHVAYAIALIAGWA